VRYTYTGNRTVEHTGLEAGAIFTITPSEVSAVA